MAFCINCGSELPDGAKFCMSCGTPNAAAAAVPAPVPEPMPEPTPVPEPAPAPVEQPAEQPVPQQAAPQSQEAPKAVKRSVQGGGFGKIMMIIAGALLALAIIFGIITIIKNAVGGSSKSLNGAGSGTALTEILDKTAATHYGGGTSKPSDSSTSSDDGEDFRGDHEESFDGEESAVTEDVGKGDDIASEAASGAAGGSTSFEILPWGKKEGGVEFTVDIPAGWSWREDYSWIVEDNENAVVTMLPFIEFKVEKSLDKFDKYKDSFENLKDIDDRVIGGVTMKGRTYKNCGYDKTQYLAQIDDERAVSIVIVKCDLSDGSVASGILDSIKMQ